MSLSDGLLSEDSRKVLRQLARTLRGLPSENSTADIVIHQIARMLEQLAAADEASAYARLT